MPPEPDDFGLPPRSTLAEVGSSVLPPGFMQFWDAWLGELFAKEVGFEEAAPSLVSAPGLTHVLRSHGDVRVGCRIMTPSRGAPTGVVVSTHGKGVPPGEPFSDDRRWADRGMLTVRLRVRGFPGSQMDTGDLTEHRGGYITHGIESPETWVLTGAAADLINAVRAARALAGPDLPISLHGESFGGGLAVLAASLLRDREPIDRLAIALPTFGHWRWRHENPIESGSGADVRRFLESHPETADDARRTLRLLDTVVHASRIHRPVVCKLAERDQVVPAPTAAAVYNALGTDPGRKWRFIVRYGHHIDDETPMADLRRHAIFEQLTAAFVDPHEDLDALMARWSAVLLEGTEAPS